jgi:hypothetical protein
VPLPPAAPLLVATFALVGVPYYFFRTLLTARAFLATGKAVLYYLALLVAQGGTAFLSATAMHPTN